MSTCCICGCVLKAGSKLGPLDYRVSHGEAHRPDKAVVTVGIHSKRQRSLASCEKEAWVRGNRRRLPGTCAHPKGMNGSRETPGSIWAGPPGEEGVAFSNHLLSLCSPFLIWKTSASMVCLAPCHSSGDFPHGYHSLFPRPRGQVPLLAVEETGDQKDRHLARLT